MSSPEAPTQEELQAKGLQFLTSLFEKLDEYDNEEEKITVTLKLSKIGLQKLNEFIQAGGLS